MKSFAWKLRGKCWARCFCIFKCCGFFCREPQWLKIWLKSGLFSAADHLCQQNHNRLYVNKRRNIAKLETLPCYFPVWSSLTKGWVRAYEVPSTSNRFWMHLNILYVKYSKWSGSSSFMEPFIRKNSLFLQ